MAGRATVTTVAFSNVVERVTVTPVAIFDMAGRDLVTAATILNVASPVSVTAVANMSAAGRVSATANATELGYRGSNFQRGGSAAAAAIFRGTGRTPNPRSGTPPPISERKRELVVGADRSSHSYRKRKRAAN